ncbi:hypothetical protein Aduo_019482 [Ancylostoma duodenale]
MGTVTVTGFACSYDLVMINRWGFRSAFTMTK